MAGGMWMAVVAAAVIEVAVRRRSWPPAARTTRRRDRGVERTGGTRPRAAPERAAARGGRRGHQRHPRRAMAGAMTQITAYGRRQTAGLVTAAAAFRRPWTPARCPGPSGPTPPDAPTTAHRAAGEALSGARPQDRRARRRLPQEGPGSGLDRLPPIERALWKDGRIAAARARAGRGIGLGHEDPGAPHGRRQCDPRGGDPRHAELVNEMRSPRSRARRSATPSSTCPPSWPTWRVRGSSSTPSLRWSRQGRRTRGRDRRRLHGRLRRGGHAPEGAGYPPYNQLSSAQQREVKQTIEALAEPLARVQGTLGVQSK